MGDLLLGSRDATCSANSSRRGSFPRHDPWRSSDAVVREGGELPNLVARVVAGDRGAVVELLERYRGRLRRTAAMRLEPRLQGRVDASDVIHALNHMGALDRANLVPRHYEQMTNGDAAAALGAEKLAANKRYTRTPQRLKDIVAGLPGEISEDSS
jgi:DNA-directed RNA polymerase specialized sigma24 family protein